MKRVKDLIIVKTSVIVRINLNTTLRELILT